MRLDGPGKRLENSAEEMPSGGHAERLERLYCAVVSQALADAVMVVAEIQPHHSTTRRAELRTKAADKAEARRWLLEDDTDFAAVCALAELNPERVRAYARKLIDDVQVGNCQLGVPGQSRHGRSVPRPGAGGGPADHRADAG